MVKLRRSLSAAMSVSPEALAFIEGAKPAPGIAQSEPIAKAEEGSDAQETIQNEPTPLTLAAPPTTSSSTSSKRRPRAQRLQTQEPEMPLGMAGLLVPLTTRVSPRVAASLKRAGLEQKLRGKKPSTVQEIVENALESWLYEAGYLDELRQTGS